MFLVEIDEKQILALNSIQIANGNQDGCLFILSTLHRYSGQSME